MAETPKTEAPEQDASPTVVIEPADNGGFTVRQHSKHGVQGHLIGAFTSGTDLMRGLPDILGLDGLRVEAHSKFGMVDNSTQVLAEVMENWVAVSEAEASR